MVVRATLRIRHHGCITERLQGDTFLTQISGERGADVFVLRAPTPAALREGLAIAESNGKRAQVLSRTDECIVFKGENERDGIVATIRASPCWILWPVVYRDGVERYQIGAPDRVEMRALVARLAKHGEVSVERVAEGAPEAEEEWVALGDVVGDLTPRQLAALQDAEKHGYYESPKRVDSETLAKRAGVSPSTHREHLRKAERALIARVVALLAERPVAKTRASRKPGRPARAR